MGNDIPLLFFLDPGFLGFVVLCAAAYGLARAWRWFRG